MVNTNSITVRSKSAGKTWKWSPGDIIFWFIWPFGSLVRALANYKSATAKTIVWLFCVYYGAAFVFPEDKPGAPDSARYNRTLISMHENPFSLAELWENVYNPEEKGYVDVYQPVVTWMVASVTDDVRWLFIVFAAVFGFFYVNNLWMAFELVKKRLNWMHILFLIGLALVNPIWYINGVRMYTGAQIFIFGILQFFLKGKKSGLIWTATSILVHFSFLFPVALLLLYILIPKSITVFFVFFLVTSFIKETDLSRVRTALSFLPGVFQPRVKSYTNLEYAAYRQESAMQKSWHVRLAGISSSWFTYLWVIAIYIKRKTWLQSFSMARELFMYALYLAGWAQLAGLIPSGGRFLLVAEFLFMFIISLILINSNKSSSPYRLARILSPLLFFVILYRIRIGFDFTGLLTFAGNLPLAFSFSHQTSLMELIKSLF